MAQPSIAYEPGDPTATILYEVVGDYVEAFCRHTASVRHGEGRPRFVEQEFRDFLRCGCLAGGSARFRCGGCGMDAAWRFLVEVAGSASGR
jgi:hypothetical protein